MGERDILLMLAVLFRFWSSSRPGATKLKPLNISLAFALIGPAGLSLKNELKLRM